MPCKTKNKGKFVNKKRVAVIGFSYRLPGTEPTRFWDALLAGRDLVTQVPADRWGQDPYLHPRKSHPGTSYTFAAGTIGDISGFDAEFFGISPREATQIDPQQRLLLELGWEAVENAGIRPKTLRGSACGVFIGISSVDYSFRVADDLAAAESAVATGTANSIAANRISYALDLRGPSLTVDTACSSSLIAFHLAYRSILSGESTHALAGGVSLHMHPYGFVTFSKASMLSRRGICNVFDAAGDGYVRSEGAGMFLLKDYARALADGDPILAIVAGTAINSDGHKSGLMVPSIEAQVALLEQAYAEANIVPADITYVEAHGTGTAVGDPVETHALGIALGQRRPPNDPLLIGSVKSNIGHLEAASGAAGLVKAMHCIAYRTVPATIHLRNPNPNIRFEEWNLRVPTATTPLKSDGRLIIGVNSFGFGGANAHVILTSPEPESGSRRQHTPEQLLPVAVSGKTIDAMKAAARALAGFLRDPGHTADLYDIAYTTVLRREWHEHRAVVQAGDKTSLADALDAIAADAAVPVPADTGAALPEDRAGVAFIYSGNGAQWDGMGRILLAEEPVFRDAVLAVDAIFRPLAGYAITDVLQDQDADHRYALTEIAQPALFAMQVGITELLHSRGLAPAAVAGHSVGEVAAAWASGALTLEQAVQVIYHRSTQQTRTRGAGQMTAVGLGKPALLEVLDHLGLSDAIAIAAVNSAQAVTVAGAPLALAQLEQALGEHKVFCRRLDLDYAFHSPAMDTVRAGILHALAPLRPGTARIPFYSSVSGNQLEGATLDAAYWWRNIREPVQFEQAIGSLLTQGLRIFVEVGPHAVLRSYLQQNLRERQLDGRIITTVLRDDEQPARIMSAVAQAAIAGAAIDWTCVYAEPGRFVPLPNYPWQRTRHWLKPSPAAAMPLERHLQHPLLGYRRTPGEWVWVHRIDTQVSPSLADHVVGETIVMPGTGYAEMAIGAANLWHQDACIEIECIEIRTPMALGDAQTKALRFSLDATDGTFSSQSRDSTEGDEWTLHATGKIAREASGARLRRPPCTLPARDADLSGVDHEQMTRAAGLCYGPAYQAIESIWLEENAVYAKFGVPPTLAGELDNTHLHPALLDCAFQLIIHLLQGETHHRELAVYVPTRIDDLTWKRGSTQPVMAQATLLRRAPHSLAARFVLYDGRGESVAVIQEVRFQRLRLHKNPLDRLRYLDFRFVARPHPLTPTLVPKQLFERLRKELTWATAPVGAASPPNRYSVEIEPLLDVLCSRFAARALRAMASDHEKLTRNDLRRHAEANPAIEPLLFRLIEMLREDEVLVPDGEAWTLKSAGDELSPEEIWNGLLRDYPDYLSIVQGVGHVGMHLHDLLTGRRTAEQIVPAEWTPGALTRQVLMDTGLPRTQHALQQVLARTLREQGAGTRLRVLEICADTPAFAASLCKNMNFDRCSYTVTAVAASPPEDCHGLRERYPQISVRVINASDNVEPTPPPAVERCELVIVNADSFSERDALFVLSYATRFLSAGGSMVIIEHQPSRWMDLVFGAKRSWWSDSRDGIAKSRHRTPGFWRNQLNRLGLHAATLLELVPGAKAGPCLLLAHAAERRTITQEQAPAAGRTWLLLTDRDADSLSSRVAGQLSGALSATGDHVILATPGATLQVSDSHHYQLDLFDAAQVEALLSQLVVDFGRIEGVLHLCGLGSTSADTTPDLLLEKQLDRCAIAAAAIRAIETMALPTTLWMVTAGVTHGWRDQSPPAAASRAQHVGTDAALGGFARTAMNECSSAVIRLVDIAPAIPLDTITYLLTRELAHPDQEQEIAFAASGERFAPRISAKPRPAAPAPHAGDGETPTTLRLGFQIPGQLRNLRWEAVPGLPPGDDELEIDVYATGLNFRDVMYTLGVLSDEAVEGGFTGPTLGLEFAGVVRRTGSRVADFAPGDRVLGFGQNSFTNRVITKAASVTRIPHGLSYEAAATIPSAFFTVHYALNHLAQLAQGEKILIHGAAGGVGIAAIQMAKQCGAEIFATAGSDQKRDFLRLMGIQHVFDSRSLDFADEILEATGGSGVDVVLNSLAGEAINRNLRILRPFGRFIELGKRDFQENTRIGLRPFRKNISYFAVDADQLMAERPALSAQLFADLMTMFEERILSPLPYRRFDAEHIVDAFRHMQQSRHIGKIIVTYEGGLPRAEAADTGNSALVLAADATYLVSGGLRGFGLKTAEWLATKGARHLVLLGRRGLHTAKARAAVDALQQAGVTVVAAACDVTDRNALARLLTGIAETMPPLRGIVHSAAVIEDGLIRNISRRQMRRVLAPKILGAHNLHELTLNRKLDFFVMYSSATTLFGNPGQASYIAANAHLEAYAAALRAAGHRALCVRWGAIDDAGYLARNSQVRDALNKRMGGLPLTAAVALDALEELLMADRSGLGVLDLDWNTLSRSLPSAGTPRFSELAITEDHGAGGDDQRVDVRSLLDTLAPTELVSTLSAILKKEIGEILRIAPEKISEHRVLNDLGFDSLMGVELTTAVEQRLNVKLPIMALNDGPTVAKLAILIVERLAGAPGEGTAPADSRTDFAGDGRRIALQYADGDDAETIARTADELGDDALGAPHRIIH